MTGWLASEMVVVRDERGELQSWDWLVAQLGPLRVERAVPARPGQLVFRLEQVRVVEGPAILAVHVSDTQGLPLEGALVVRTWAGAPGLPAWPAVAHRWRDRGVYGATGQAGAVGFGLSPDDIYRLPDTGPSAVWVADPAGPSDWVEGLGLVASEKRLHLDLFFRVAQELAPVLSDAGTALSDSPAALEPPAPPPPPPAPLPLAADQWALLVERLDRVIQSLEEQSEE